MKVETTRETAYSELAVEGSLDVESAHGLESAVAGLMTTGEKFFALNFARLEYMDSYGLGKLISMFRKMAANGGAGVLHSVPANIMHIFELTRLHLVFEIFGDSGEARCRLEKLAGQARR